MIECAIESSLNVDNGAHVPVHSTIEPVCVMCDAVSFVDISPGTVSSLHTHGDRIDAHKQPPWNKMPN